jgi:hypothetical protein
MLTTAGSFPSSRWTKTKQWAHVDLNHGPRPYQGRALTELSYGPNLGIGKCIAAVLAQREPRLPATAAGTYGLRAREGGQA